MQDENKIKKNKMSRRKKAFIITSIIFIIIVGGILLGQSNPELLIKIMKMGVMITILSLLFGMIYILVYAVIS